MTPMVVFSDKDGRKKVMYDSQDILLELCPFLYPQGIKNDVVELESYLGSHLGPTIRCFLYYYLLEKQNHGVLIKMAKSSTSFIEGVLFENMLDRGIASAMKRAMKINTDSAKQSIETIRKVFEEISNKLAINENGTIRKRDHIMDTDNISYGLTSADLTFCSLAAPLLAPMETENFYVHDDDEIPNDILNLKHELLGTLAGQHVIDIYRKYRIQENPSHENSKKPHLKIMARDRLPVGMQIGIAVGALSTISFLSRI